MVNNKDMQFFIENLKIKRKKDKFFLTFRNGDLNPRFSVIFPPMIWIFIESEEDEIKSKQASKKDRTLSTDFLKLYRYCSWYNGCSFISKVPSKFVKTWWWCKLWNAIGFGFCCISKTGRISKTTPKVSWVYSNT